MENNEIKLAISLCSNRPSYPRPFLAFGMLLHTLTAHGVPFVIISRMQASLLPSARQQCQNEALQMGCTHQLWWDDDIEHPHDCVLRMLQAMKQNPEIDVIAANYCRKQDTLQYTAEDLSGNNIESAGKIGLQEASKTGMGLMLVKLDKIRDIAKPHFEVVWMDAYQEYQGEDRYFCRKLRAAGVRIFVDHGLSNWTQHWGEMGYNFRLWDKNTSLSDVDIRPGQRA